jgi:hypothetical protein
MVFSLYRQPLPEFPSRSRECKKFQEPMYVAAGCLQAVNSRSTESDVDSGARVSQFSIVRVLFSRLVRIGWSRFSGSNFLYSSSAYASDTGISYTHQCLGIVAG